MASLDDLLGQVFQPTNVSENGFEFDSSQYASSGTITVSPSEFESDSDHGITDTQTVTAVDTTGGASKLGTVTLTDTNPQTGTSLAIQYDVLGISADGSMVFLASGLKADPGDGGPFYSTYTIISNKSLAGDGKGLSFPLVFSNQNPNAYAPPCFAAGTRILTPDGEVAVELLQEGDLVVTGSGAVRPIRWVGRRRVDVRRHPMPETVRPVRIAAGAFENRVPVRALTVSPDHNLLLEDVLIPAKCLVDGLAVRQLTVDEVTYHHIELDTHDVVIADGMQAETYLDTGNRSAFVGASVTALHPNFGSFPDLNYFAWEAAGYARLVVSGPELERARAKLASRTGRLRRKRASA